jgi:DNA-3-methyladenine glycosylase
MRKVLRGNFYSRDTATVARELLGNTLVRKQKDKELGGIIVETEAYYGEDDPASRAFQGKKKYNVVMYGEPGHLFIYNVHRYWMLNLIAHLPGKVGGVLIRAIEPTIGVEEMKKNRPVKKLTILTNGPGKLTLALNVDKSLNGLSVTREDSIVQVRENTICCEVGTSNRIGVSRDLEEELRFYIIGNEFVSV